MKRSRIMKFSGLILLVVLLCLLYLRLYGGRLEQRLSSPNGKFIVQHRVLMNGGATESAQDLVEIHGRLNPWRHSIFSGLNYGAEIRASWADSTHLLIQCRHCIHFQICRQETEFKAITINYQIEY